jgi:hypothetical protein
MNQATQRFHARRNIAKAMGQGRRDNSPSPIADLSDSNDLGLEILAD